MSLMLPSQAPHSLEELLSGALSLLVPAKSLWDAISVKERVQVLFHVDVWHQLVRRFLSTIS